MFNCIFSNLPYRSPISTAPPSTHHQLTATYYSLMLLFYKFFDIISAFLLSYHLITVYAGEHFAVMSEPVSQTWVVKPDFVSRTLISSVVALLSCFSLPVPVSLLPRSVAESSCLSRCALWITSLWRFLWTNHTQGHWVNNTTNVVLYNLNNLHKRNCWILVPPSGEIWPGVQVMGKRTDDQKENWLYNRTSPKSYCDNVRR